MPASRADTLVKGSRVERTFGAEFTVRAAQDGTGGTRYDLEGYASVYDEPYEMYDMFGPYEEVVEEGSGAKTLSESPDVVLRFNHAGLPFARTKPGTLELSEDSHGLHMRAPSINGGIQVVKDVVTLIEEGALDQMSFAFRIVRFAWSPDYMQFNIKEYNLHRGDVAVVTFGANPATSVALRSDEAALTAAATDRAGHLAPTIVQSARSLRLAEAEAAAYAAIRRTA